MLEKIQSRRREWERKRNKRERERENEEENAQENRKIKQRDGYDEKDFW